MEKLKQYIKEFKSQNFSHFDDFYQLTSRQVYFSIITIIKSADHTEDLMQDTYMRFIEKIDQYDFKYNPVAYISTIARNMAINEYHSHKKLVHDELVLDMTPSKETVDEKMMILDLLDDLKDIQRDIVVMHVINEMKFKDIAAMLEMPLGTVQWHYQEAINQLKDMVGDLK